jgi:hypothetical protein
MLDTSSPSRGSCVSYSRCLRSWCPALLALVAPGEQLPARALLQVVVTHGGAAAAALVVACFLVVQLGHAMDCATEKLLAASRARLSALSAHAPAVALPFLRAAIGSAWLLECHCLGDYYSSYWPDAHPLSATPTACLVCIWPGGSECLLPAITDFYWRR